MSIKTDAPGPGNYEPRPEIIKDRIKSAKISQGGKRGLQGNKSCIDLPGPGMYDSGKKFGDDARKVTIQGKPNDNFRDLSPGPGAYDARDEMTKCKNPSYNLGHERRQSFLDKTAMQNPGPGSYTSQYKTFASDAPAVSIRGKPKDLQRNDSPGPGAYE